MQDIIQSPRLKQKRLRTPIKRTVRAILRIALRRKLFRYRPLPDGRWDRWCEVRSPCCWERLIVVRRAGLVRDYRFARSLGECWR